MAKKIKLSFQRLRTEPIDRVKSPIEELVHSASTGGIILLCAAVVALFWANSQWAESYQALWKTKISFGFGEFELSKPLLLWINDGLMAAFFFVVGLEIKREVLVGELADVRKATLPIAAAVGGMLVPALIYYLINPEPPAVRGWGVPMATDIAFALGVLALVGKGVPIGLKVFLSALAIVDDIGATLVIAIFYTENISLDILGISAVFFASLVAINMLGFRSPIPYWILGFFFWFAFLKSGVHPTIAGILAAMTIPARAKIDADDLIESSRELIREFRKSGDIGGSVLTNARQNAVIQAIENATELAQTPLQRLERAMHGWIVLLVIPVFALANAGVAVEGSIIDSLMTNVSLGIMAGLILGKQIGVTFFAWLVVKLGWAELPQGVNWMQIYGASWLAAIGFTMSIFVANLAFDSEALLSSAKIGILSGSFVAGICGFVILRFATANRVLVEN